MRSLALFVALFSFWVMLSGQIHSVFLMGSGVVCCALTVWICRRMDIVDSEGFGIEYSVRFVLYIPWLVYQVLLANLDVAMRVWRPRMPISPCVVEVPYSTRTSFGAATYANSITLTPGTVSIEVRDRIILVHALTSEAGDALGDGSMEKRVRKVEGTA